MENFEFYLSVCKFPINTTRDEWTKVFYDLREGEIQWMFQNFMLEKIVARGAKHPFLVLPGIRGMRPYNPSRVMRQFGKR